MRVRGWVLWFARCSAVCIDDVGKNEWLLLGLGKPAALAAFHEASPRPRHLIYGGGDGRESTPVLVGTEQGVVAALDEGTGYIFWRHVGSPDRVVSLRSTGTAVLAVVRGEKAFRALVLDPASGRLLHRQTLPAGPADPVPVLAADGSDLYIVSGGKSNNSSISRVNISSSDGGKQLPVPVGPAQDVWEESGDILVSGAEAAKVWSQRIDGSNRSTFSVESSDDHIEIAGGDIEIAGGSTVSIHTCCRLAALALSRGIGGELAGIQRAANGEKWLLMSGGTLWDVRCGDDSISVRRLPAARNPGFVVVTREGPRLLLSEGGGLVNPMEMTTDETVLSWAAGKGRLVAAVSTPSTLLAAFEDAGIVAARGNDLTERWKRFDSLSLVEVSFGLALSDEQATHLDNRGTAPRIVTKPSFGTFLDIVEPSHTPAVDGRSMGRTVLWVQVAAGVAHGLRGDGRLAWTAHLRDEGEPDFAAVPVSAGQLTLIDGGPRGVLETVNTLFEMDFITGEIIRRHPRGTGMVVRGNDIFSLHVEGAKASLRRVSGSGTEPLFARHQDRSSSTIRGWRLTPPPDTGTTGPAEEPAWQLNLGMHNYSLLDADVVNGERRSRHRDGTRHPGPDVQIRGDGTVLHKYQTNAAFHMLAQRDLRLELLTVNSATGGVLSSLTLPDGVTAGRLSTLHFENSVILAAHDVKTRGNVIVAVDFYFDERDSGPLSLLLGRSSAAETFSAYQMQPPLVFNRTYILDRPVAAMAVTKTRGRLTSPQIVVATNSEQLFALPQSLLSARRPVVLTPGDQQKMKSVPQVDKEEGLAAYHPLLRLLPPLALSHHLRVNGIHTIETSPIGAGEASTAIIASGLDTFVALHDPASKFDGLDETFSRVAVISTVAALSVGVVFAASLAKRKQQRRKWD